MKFKWIDYSKTYNNIVESWLDEEAICFTGLDEGFEDYLHYWISNPDTKYGENFWAKVILENDLPIGIIVISLWDGEFTVPEIVVSPDRRGKGIGTAVLKEWIDFSGDIVGVCCQKAKAVIFPNNIASQKAFGKAGFIFVSAHPDGDAWNYEYRAV